MSLQVNSPVNSKTVAIFSDERCSYNSTPPFNPNKLYPEYPFGEANVEKGNPDLIDTYYAVRQIFYLLGYDKENFNTPNWNPLGHIIKPGQNVVLKPNFILHYNEAGYDIFSTITHPSVIRAVADYCVIALKGQGTITLAEAPQMNCEFDKIESITNLNSLTNFYKENSNVEFKVIDIRKLTCKFDYDKGYFPSDSFKINENADPLGYAIVDLGENSYLHNLPALDRLYGADYDRKFTVMNHSNGVHKYCISKTVLNADTVVLLPKMKTHKKVGVTLNIKLLVGINGDKNYLAHYRLGTPKENGDEYPDTDKMNVEFTRQISHFINDFILKKRSRIADKVFLLGKSIFKPMLDYLREKQIIKKPSSKDKIYGGNWYGNDTAWRMASDLARILLYCDKDGNMKDSVQRCTFSIVDGIIAGEGDGPMSPVPKHIGTLVAGENILAVDTASSTLMGFDYKKIKMLYNSWYNKKWQLADFEPHQTTVISNLPELTNTNVEKCIKFNFDPHPQWEGFIELLS